MPLKKTRRYIQPNRPALRGPGIDSLERRASKMDAPMILDSMEVQESNLAQLMAAYRRTQEMPVLWEIKLTSEAIYILATELESRKQAVFSEAEVAPTRQASDRPKQINNRPQRSSSF